MHPTASSSLSGPARMRPMPLFVRLALATAALLLLGLSACSKSYPNCDDDSTCKSKGEVCVDGLCRQCGNDSHCTKIDACLTCSANECVKRSGCCKSDLDCPTGKCWRNDGEATGRCGAGCSDEHPCPAGQRCANGACVPDACSDANPCPAGQRCDGGRCVAACTIEPVLFDFNEHVIRLDQEAVASANAECIRSSQYNVRVEGHADERGSDEYNLALGQRRANSLNELYKRLGVPAGLLKGTISYGEERPSCNQPDESCWQKNRRAETSRQ